MRKILFLLVFLILISFSAKYCFAQSNYVLPYPSSMPGSAFYRLHLIWEKLMQYWYFGDFGQFDYNLREADKYLVEAKTLFEYNQYLLGYKALKKSDSYFLKIKPNLQHALINGKPVFEKKAILHQAAVKHIEVLEVLKTEVPVTFKWSPEKMASSDLDLFIAFNKSEFIRKSSL